MNLLSAGREPFAVPDQAREGRTGFPEAVYAPGKTPAEIVGLLHAGRGSSVRFVTRVEPDVAWHCLRWEPGGVYHARARLLAFGQAPTRETVVAVVTGGTADLRVAWEARAVLQHMGVRVAWLPDRGVAYPQRSQEAAADIRGCRCAIVVAGFDGALPTYLAAAADVTVIAVPTSTGYGVAADGSAPLHTALSSCADGLTVVNVDDGFGAAAAALRIVGR